MKNQTVIEYGIVRNGGTPDWADDDGELHIPNSVTGSSYVTATDLPEILRALAHPRLGFLAMTLVQRAVTTGPTIPYVAPGATPPTTPGSVVRATTGGRGEGVYVLTNSLGDLRWSLIAGEGAPWANASDFTRLTVVFDAPTLETVAV